MPTLLLSILVLVLLLLVYLKHPKFGKSPSGESLERIKKSPNYKNGKFQNLRPTPMLSEGHSYFTVMYEGLFKASKRTIPKDLIPSQKTDLFNLDRSENLLVWFGHSSYFMQVDGKRILVDPVLSKHASPIPNIIKAFKGTNVYSAEDIPEIDYLFITHDHYDHLDYATVTKLKPKIKKVICGLGVGSYFEGWDYDKSRIIETDWNEEISLEPGFKVFTHPTRHFSGRAFFHRQTLWQSYLLESPSLKIFMGGDGGYDDHFAEIGKKFGPIDLAILENGQYNPAWKHLHTSPQETLQAAQDLQAKRIFPVHSAKFKLSNHAWDEPLIRLSELSQNLGIPLVTPMIGQLVNLSNPEQEFQQWWLGVE